MTVRVGVHGGGDGGIRPAARAARRTALEHGLSGALPERAAECAGELARVLARHFARSAVYVQPPALRHGLDIVAVGADPGPGDGPDPGGPGRWPAGAHAAGPLPGLEAVRHLADDFVLRAAPGAVRRSARGCAPSPGRRTARGRPCRTSARCGCPSTASRRAATPGPWRSRRRTGR